MFSFKKPHNNAQGGQSRANVSTVHSSDSTNASIPRGTQNGAHIQPHLHGMIPKVRFLLLFNHTGTESDYLLSCSHAKHKPCWFKDRRLVGNLLNGFCLAFFAFKLLQFVFNFS